MKKIILVISVMTVFQVTAQSNAELKQHYEAYYSQMRNQGDVRGAINALTHLDILAPSQARKDTLAYLYANSGQYLQAVNVLGSESKSSDSELAMRVKAISLKSLNQPQLAIVHYKALFDRKPNAYFAYELADLNLQIGNVANAKKHIDYGLNNAMDTDMQSFYESNPPYQVPLKAAFIYLRGLLEYNQNQANIDTAIKSIDEAIALAPNFSLARQIKNALIQQKQQKGQ